MTARADPPKNASVLVANDWRDYKILDSGEGEKLEQVGPYRFVRPDAQALWRKRLDAREWQKADAIFTGGSGDDEDGGRWKFNRELPQSWPLHWDTIRFVGRPTPFRHLAFFPEHSVHWRFAREALQNHKSDKQPEVLNLFGYTGLASLVCAEAGAKVTHVDASKKAIGFARENQAAAGLEDKPIRWIVDDALTFVQREIRRGRHYDGIILDPPKFGRGPNGETWRLEEQLRELLEACATLLREDANDSASARGFMIATVYAVRLSFLALEQTMRDSLPNHGAWQAGDMALAHASDERVLPTAIFARWKS